MEDVHWGAFALAECSYLIEVDEGELYEKDTPSILSRIINANDYLYAEDITFEGCILNED